MQANTLFQRKKAVIEYRPALINGEHEWYWSILPLPDEAHAVATGNAKNKGTASMQARQEARRKGYSIAGVRVRHTQFTEAAANRIRGIMRLREAADPDKIDPQTYLKHAELQRCPNCKARNWEWFDTQILNMPRSVRVFRCKSCNLHWRPDMNPAPKMGNMGGCWYPDQPIKRLGESVSSEAAKAEEPTDGQIEAGNYKKGHVSLFGLDISIENAKGSERSGTNKEGKEWSVTLPAHYGYIKGTEGKDKDHVDVYIGPDEDSEKVFVVNQNKEKGGFDEHKCMLCFSNREKAIAAYDKAFTGDLGPKLRGSVVSTTVDKFKTWLESGDTKKPFKTVAESMADDLLEGDPDEVDPKSYLTNGPFGVMRNAEGQLYLTFHGQPVVWYPDEKNVNFVANAYNELNQTKPYVGPLEPFDDWYWREKWGKTFPRNNSPHYQPPSRKRRRRYEALDPDDVSAKEDLFRYVSLCHKCGGYLSETGYCTDDTCPYKDWPQYVDSRDIFQKTRQELEYWYGIKKRRGVEESIDPDAVDPRDELRRYTKFDTDGLIDYLKKTVDIPVDYTVIKNVGDLARAQAEFYYRKYRYGPAQVKVSDPMRAGEPTKIINAVRDYCHANGWYLKHVGNNPNADPLGRRWFSILVTKEWDEQHRPVDESADDVDPKDYLLQTRLQCRYNLEVDLPGNEGYFAALDVPIMPPAGTEVGDEIDDQQWYQEFVNKIEGNAQVPPDDVPWIVSLRYGGDSSHSKLSESNPDDIDPKEFLHTNAFKPKGSLNDMLWALDTAGFRALGARHEGNDWRIYGYGFGTEKSVRANIEHFLRKAGFAVPVRVNLSNHLKQDTRENRDFQFHIPFFELTFTRDRINPPGSLVRPDQAG